jgi:hypothetical protein
LDLPSPMLARLKHGPVLTLVDLSEGGALIETAARLNPGAHVILEFMAPGAKRTTMVPSRVMRAQVTSMERGILRYRGGFAFRQLLQLADLAFAPEQAPTGPTNSTGVIDAIVHIRSLADGAGDAHVARMLDDILHHAHECAAPRTLMRFVEDQIRRNVPLLTVAFGARARVETGRNDVLAFELGTAEVDDLQRMYVEFRPACRLDEAQIRLLHAGASVMSLIYNWHRALIATR